MLEKLVEALRDGCGYDFVANNYTEFSKAELKMALLEAIYVIRENVGIEAKDGEDTLADSIEEWI